MGNVLNAGIAIIVSVHLLMLATASPAVAINVELAKKCRDLAIKAHPPEIAGTKAYAQAERDFFRECVEKNGQMNNGGAQKAPSGQE